MKWIGLLIFLMINYTVSAQSQRVVGNYVQSQLGEQFNSWFYLSANDSSGTELWKTQGDTAHFVKDFYLVIQACTLFKSKQSNSLLKSN